MIKLGEHKLKIKNILMPSKRVAGQPGVT